MISLKSRKKIFVILVRGLQVSLLLFCILPITIKNANAQISDSSDDLVELLDEAIDDGVDESSEPDDPGDLPVLMEDSGTDPTPTPTPKPSTGPTASPGKTPTVVPRARSNATPFDENDDDLIDDDTDLGADIEEVDPGDVEEVIDDTDTENENVKPLVTPTLTPTRPTGPSATSTPKPSRTATPAARACDVKEILLLPSRNGQKSQEHEQIDSSAKPILTGAATSLSCMNAIFKHCKSSGAQEYGNDTDDCVARHFDVIASAPWSFRGDWDSHSFTIVGSGDYVGAINSRTYCDQSCRCSSRTDPSCVTGIGAVNWVVSPVSLLVKQSVNIDQESTVTNFPLDPTKPGSLFTWKASEQAPLLVFDPSHKGQIKSAAQLFGNHTFGKQFKNGFEAIATLDTNKDAKVSGSELSSLGLWFDKNRDGISQKGEVKSLA